MNPPELTPEERLMRSLEDFRRALYGRRTVGVLRIADLAHLRVLIDRYPTEAREMLATTCRESDRRQSMPRYPH